MARLVLHKQTGHSTVFTKSGESIEICRCGLTKDKDGLCDDSHLVTLDEEEGKVYCYDENLQREEVAPEDKKGHCGGSCGGGCKCGHD